MISILKASFNTPNSITFFPHSVAELFLLYIGCSTAARGIWGNKLGFFSPAGLTSCRAGSAFCYGVLPERSSKERTFNVYMKTRPGVWLMIGFLMAGFTPISEAEGQNLIVNGSFESSRFVTANPFDAVFTLTPGSTNVTGSAIANEFLSEGLITENAFSTIHAAAAKSDCGKK